MILDAGTIFSNITPQTVSAVLSFFLAMCNYPEVQAKAQAEIDFAIVEDRLPDLDDRTKLPYCNAIALEVLRWQPVMPLGKVACSMVL
jgi:cytochrome P450